MLAFPLSWELEIFWRKEFEMSTHRWIQIKDTKQTDKDNFAISICVHCFVVRKVSPNSNHSYKYFVNNLWTFVRPDCKKR